MGFESENDSFFVLDFACFGGPIYSYKKFFIYLLTRTYKNSIFLALTARIDVRGCGYTHKRCHEGVIR